MNFNVLTSIINPIPPDKPVINLKILLLSLYPNNCVNPSISVGINKNMANIVVINVYVNGKYIANIMYVNILM